MRELPLPTGPLGPLPRRPRPPRAVLGWLRDAVHRLRRTARG